MSDIVMLAARILLVAIFPISGYFKIVRWPQIATVLDNAGLPFPQLLGGVGAGMELLLPLLIAIGLFTRVSAIGLIVYTLVATFIGHKFWVAAPPEFFGQLMNFMKNLSMVGGFLVLAVTGPGRFAVSPKT